MKNCQLCQQIKSFSEFYKRKQNKDGYRSICKACWLLLCKQYRQTIKGKITQKRYNQSQKGKAKRIRYLKSSVGKVAHKRNRLVYYTSHPDRIKARSAVYCDISSGRIPKIKTRRCYFCYNPANQYHHYKGYKPEFWLDVIPICQKCHNIHYKKRA